VLGMVLILTVGVGCNENILVTRSVDPAIVISIQQSWFNQQLKEYEAVEVRAAKDQTQIIREKVMLNVEMMEAQRAKDVDRINTLKEKSHTLDGLENSLKIKRAENALRLDMIIESMDTWDTQYPGWWR